MATRRSVDHRRKDERGLAVLFFGLSITALLTVAALVLGGSIGYTAVRNAQTAADAAALAGTSAVRAHKQDWISMPADDVLAEVESVVEDNGATLPPDGCELVTAEYALSHDEQDVVADCADLDSLSEEEFVSVAGVRVTVEDTRDVPFAAFVSENTITGTAEAAATAQQVSEGRSPFMVCASPEAVGHPAPVLLPSGTGYVVNKDARGKHYVLQGNQMKEPGSGRDCGNDSSSWRGLVDFDSPYALPSPDPTNDAGWWEIETGNKNGQLPRLIAGPDACELDGDPEADLEVGCRIAIPLCPMGNGKTGENFRLYCYTLGAFEISYVGKKSSGDAPCHATERNNIVCGEFLGAATAARGRGVAATPDANAVVVVKLVQ